MNLETFNKAKHLLSDIQHHEKNIKILQKALKHQTRFAVYNSEYEFDIPLEDSNLLVEKELKELKAQLEGFEEAFKNL